MANGKRPATNGTGLPPPQVGTPRTSAPKPALPRAPAPASTPQRPAGAAPPSVPPIHARTSGLKLKPQHADVKQRLREGALDTVLNAASMLRDVWSDFRSSDRYFKFKALILGTWVVLTLSTFAVACPESLDARNRLGARLVLAGEETRPIYMLVNDSDDPWEDVIVVVNGKYRTAAGRVEPKGGTLTLTPKQLKADNDAAVPPDLRIRDLQLRTSDGETFLMKEGELR
jgi:hypothetical protein